MHTLLLGAGASVDAGLPATKKLTADLLECFRAAGPSAHSDVLTFAVGGLQFRAGIAGQNPIDETPDIEAVLRAIELLERREQSEAAAFIGSWHPRVAELERAAPEVFKETRELVLERLKQLLWIRDARDLKYLQPLRSILSTQQRLEVATLNFDNVIETFASSSGIECSAGLDPREGFSYRNGYQFRFRDSGINLMKLHGSLGWNLHYPPDGLLPFVLPRGGPSDQFKYASPAVLFGEAQKLTAHGPYLELLARFQSVLRDTVTLTIVGYSFRDPHINDQIGAYILRRTSNSVRIIDPAELTAPFMRTLQKVCAGRVHVIRAEAGAGLAEAFAA